MLPFDSFQNRPVGSSPDSLTSWQSMAAFQPVSVKVSAINDHLVCHLCGGYIMEATAVVECLHACELLERVAGRSNVITMCTILYPESFTRPLFGFLILVGTLSWIPSCGTHHANIETDVL